MEKSSMRILLVEDNPGDARLIHVLLEEASTASIFLPSITVRHTDRLAAAITALEEQEVDVVLLDLSLPDSFGVETVARLREVAPNLPIVVLTGSDDEALSLQAMQEGAQDFLPKNRADEHTLARALRYAVEREQATREVNRLKDEFVSLVSHELRTPLTSIKGYTDLLMRGEAGAMPEEQREFVGIIKSNADRLVTLVGDMLDLSRLETGKVEIKHVPLDLHVVLAGVVRTMRPLLDAKQQRLTLDLPGALSPALGDEERLVQVFVNLLSNAIKYTPVGGAIVIKGRTVERAVQVDVIDTGIGMSREELDRLFTKFFRAQHRLVRSQSGTGLGLVITRSLIERQGGQIHVESTPGVGSTFRIIMRAAERAVSVVNSPSGDVSAPTSTPPPESLLAALPTPLPRASLTQRPPAGRPADGAIAK